MKERHRALGFFVSVAIVLTSLFLLAACGGGGGGGGDDTAPPPGARQNWDEVQWDIDLWQ